MFIRINDKIFEYKALNGQSLAQLLDDEVYKVEESYNIIDVCDVCETEWLSSPNNYFEYLDTKKEKIPVDVFVKDMLRGELLNVKLGIRTSTGIIWVAELTAQGNWVTLLK